MHKKLEYLFAQKNSKTKLITSSIVKSSPSDSLQYKC